MWIIKATSECGTYKETMRCKSQAEADMYADALRADGWTVKVDEK
jgi:hypothetical protein